MSKILVVDDDAQIRSLFEVVLSGIKHEIVFAVNGLQAWDLLSKTHKDEQFEFLITDISMPEMSGEELIERVTSSYPEIYCMAISGRIDSELAINLINIGCRSFLEKPLSKIQIINGFDTLSMARSRMLTICQAKAKEMASKHLKLQKEYSEMQETVHLAHQSYEDIVIEDLRAIPNECEYKFMPYSQIGGDIFGIEERVDGSLAFFVADVAGHDISASYPAVLLKTLFAKFCDSDSGPSSFCNYANNMLLRNSNKRMVTCQVFVLDASRNSLIMCGAAHPPSLLLSSDGSMQSLKSTSGVLGVLNGVDYEEVSVPYESGQRIFLYTDGITELTRVNGKTGEKQVFGIDGLGGTLKSFVHLPVKDQIENTWSKMLQFSRNHVNDDLFLMGISI